MIKKILLTLIFPIVSVGQQINTNFGNNGSVITDYDNNNDFFGELLTLPDGKVLLFGNSHISSNSNLNGFAVIKYNDDGSLDNTFGIKGKVILNFDSYQDSKPTSAILQNDGKILIAGTTANNFRGAITRLLPNGQVDVDFGYNGKMILESKEINKVLLTPDEKIILLGKTTNNFSIEKLNQDGFYDTTFGNNGITTLDDNNNFEEFISGEIMSDGTIICAGNSSNPTFTGNKVVITKFNTNGIFDTNYGIKRINIPVSSFNQNTAIRDLKVFPDYSMILLTDGVYMNANLQSTSGSRIYKTDTNGNLITSFATNGYFQFDGCFGCETRLQNLEILQNQKFIVVLYAESNSGIAAIFTYLFNANGSLNTTFGSIATGLDTDFTQYAKTKVYNNKLYTAYNRVDPRNDYYINSHLIDNQFLSTSNFENNDKNSIVYPNPFTDKININFKDLDLQNIKISIFNLNGSEIFSKNFNNFQNNETLSIDDLSKYAAGIYFLKIQADNYNKTFKIIKN